MANKPVTSEEKKYVAYKAFDFKAHFEYKLKHYEPGDVFTPFESLTRDAATEKLRDVKRKNGRESKGLVFYEIGDVISSDPKERNNPEAERYVYRYVLPVKEA